MTDAIYIGLWAHLFCGPLSEDGEFFGWLKRAAYGSLPGWAFKPLIGCAKCHAGQVAFWWQIAVCVQAKNPFLFDPKIVLTAIFLAIIFDTLKEVSEAWINR
jgi:hypothetical protein